MEAPAQSSGFYPGVQANTLPQTDHAYVHPYTLSPYTLKPCPPGYHGTMTQTRTVEMLLGKGKASLRVPASAELLRGRTIPTLANPEAAIAAALAEPIGSPPLREVIRRRRDELGREIQSVVITISDITRPVPNEPIIEGLLVELAAQGVSEDRVCVLVATGMHRPSTAEEIAIMLGPSLPGRIEVVDHEADKLDTVRKVTDDPVAGPVSVNTRYLDADVKIVTGLIEPHFMAGFSGGRKGICPGIVDLNTVQTFHGHATMGDPNSVEGRLEGNPCHEIAIRVARIAGCDFLVNVAIDHDRQPAGVYAGDMIQAHLTGCREVAQWNAASVETPYDLVVTNAGGFPLDQNFYQTVKCMCTALPALKQNATLAVLSTCKEIGGDHYAELMFRYEHDWRAFLRDIAATDRTEKDQWELQMQCRVLERVGVEGLRLCCDGLAPEVQRRLNVNPILGPEYPGDDAIQRLQGFVDAYATQHPDARIAVIPEGPYTMLTEPVGLG